MNHKNINESVESSMANANLDSVLPATESIQPPTFTVQAKIEQDAEEVEESSEKSYVFAAAGAGDPAGNGTEGEDDPTQLKSNNSTTQDQSLTPPASPFRQSNEAEKGDYMSQMEHSFGQSFSDVNIHQNSEQATQLNARAFAQGNDIHFAPGQFNPNTMEGRSLLGHELTHVVQQREGRVSPTIQQRGFSINNDSALEQEADEMGARAAKGEVLQAFSLTGHFSNAERTQLKSSDAPIQRDLLSVLGLESSDEFRERSLRESRESRARSARELEERRTHPEQWLVAFSEQGGQNVIHEYDRSHSRRSESSYISGRNYYRVNDVILTDNFQPHWLRRIFPDIDQLIGEDEGVTYWDVLGSYLDSSYGERKIGWKITSINTTNAETGQGSVALQAVLYITDNEAVEIPGSNGAQNHSRDSLHNRFNDSLIYAALNTGIQVIGSVTEFCMSIMTGSIGASAIGRTLGAAGLRMLPNVLRGPVLRIVRFIGGSLVQSAARIANTVIRDIEQQEENNQIRERAGEEVREMDYSGIIVEAVVAEFTRIITARFASFISDSISEGLAESLPDYMQQSLGARLKTYIAQQLASGLGRPLNLGNAWARARRRARRGESMHDVLGEELLRALAPSFRDPGSAAQSILGSFVENFTQ